MPILKICGVLLILGAGGAAAAFILRFEKRKIAVLAGWSDLIWYIRSQIDCYLMPLPEIMAGADRALLDACCFQSAGRPDLTAVYHASQIYLDPEARRLLCAFVREIGSGYREELIRRCDYYISSLGKIRAKRMEELPARGRVATAVCLGAAALAAILLW